MVSDQSMVARVRRMQEKEQEKRTEVYLVDRAFELGGKAYKFVSPGNVGVPDRIIVLPGGKVFFAEVKGPTGRLSTMQRKQGARLRALGMKFYVVKSREQVDEMMAREGGDAE